MCIVRKNVRCLWLAWKSWKTFENVLRWHVATWSSSCLQCLTVLNVKFWWVQISYNLNNNVRSSKSRPTDKEKSMIWEKYKDRAVNLKKVHNLVFKLCFCLVSTYKMKNSIRWAYKSYTFCDAWQQHLPRLCPPSGWQWDNVQSVLMIDCTRPLVGTRRNLVIWWSI